MELVSATGRAAGSEAGGQGLGPGSGLATPGPRRALQSAPGSFRPPRVLLCPSEPPGQPRPDRGLPEAGTQTWLLLGPGQPTYCPAFLSHRRTTGQQGKAPGHSSRTLLWCGKRGTQPFLPPAKCFSLRSESNVAEAVQHHGQGGRALSPASTANATPGLPPCSPEPPPCPPPHTDQGQSSAVLVLLGLVPSISLVLCAKLTSGGCAGPALSHTRGPGAPSPAAHSPPGRRPGGQVVCKQGTRASS